MAPRPRQGVHPAGLELALAPLDIGVRTEGQIEIARGADDRVGLAPLAGPTQRVAVSEVDPCEVVPQRQPVEQRERLLERSPRNRGAVAASAGEVLMRAQELLRGVNKMGYAQSSSLPICL